MDILPSKCFGDIPFFTPKWGTVNLTIYGEPGSFEGRKYTKEKTKTGLKKRNDLEVRLDFRICMPELFNRKYSIFIRKVLKKSIKNT